MLIYSLLIGRRPAIILPLFMVKLKRFFAKRSVEVLRIEESFNEQRHNEQPQRIYRNACCKTTSGIRAATPYLNQRENTADTNRSNSVRYSYIGLAALQYICFQPGATTYATGNIRSCRVDGSIWRALV